MLQSKTDEAIKSYLSEVGELETISKLFESQYYVISYGDNINIKVRFSDHFSDDNPNDINIVRTSIGLYVIQTIIGVNFTVREEDVISYLKSLLLLFPEIQQTCNNFKSALQQTVKNQTKAVRQVLKLEAFIEKKSEEFNLADEIWDENKKLQKTINDLNNTVQIQKTQYTELKKQFNKTQSHYDKLVKVFNVIKEAIKKL